MKHSIGMKLFSTMNIVVVIFAALLIFLHFTFFESYVIDKNNDMLEKTYESINHELISTGSLTTSYLEKFESQTGLHITILNSDYEFVYAVTMQGEGEQPQSALVPNEAYGKIIEAHKDVIKSNGFIHAENQPENPDYLFLIGILDSGDYLILRTPVPMIDTSIEYSRFFIIITGLLTMAMSVVITFLISRHFVKPIVEINAITRNMTHLDFSKKYTGKNNDEVGELGHNINSLSGQLETTIHQLQKTNCRLEEEVKKERQIDEMRQNLLANISHDLKTPLAIIQGYAEGLRENVKETQEDRDFYCSVIIDEAERMNKLVRQILTLSQLELGKMTPEIESFEISSFINATVEKFNLMFEEREISVNNLVPRTIIAADSGMLSQVLVNLISNAADHTANGGQIIIDSQYMEQKIRIRVFNEGKPIPEDEMDKIWLSFYKVDKARTRTYGGTGIGLTIVKTIMDAHKNQCGAYNNENGVT
ncbi:MAG: HAMP domain-containing sensor histidine kinase, partial [Bacillota bacterium]|nr:HAMP domain-containing sensor histidine kinase [Bacillota bacterium]